MTLLISAITRLVAAAAISFEFGAEKMPAYGGRLADQGRHSGSANSRRQPATCRRVSVAGAEEEQESKSGNARNGERD